MSKFKNICKGFFGLQEVINVSAEKYDAIKDKIAPEVEVNITETELEEAQLINNLSDYNGHVMYQLRDPQEAAAVAKDIQRWTTKKGFTIISHKKSNSGRTGYFYFRIGEDPGSESQKIQGYFAQLPELVKFAFKAPRSKQPKQMKRRKF
tara:strand:- start:73 stop:522 length:450 start_codon:yes stop_codon:yes gene_type:complete